jgi:arsenate reductase (glutaredoxin)
MTRAQSGSGTPGPVGVVTGDGDEETVRLGGTADETVATLLFNPSCSKSRHARSVFDERGVDYVVVDYLVAPPTRAALQEIVDKLDAPVADLVRTGDPGFAALFRDPADITTPDEVIELLLAHPELLQRPIVIRDDRAVIARSDERLNDILE